MSDFDYEHWWGLHLRNAKGEVLTGPEKAEYVAGLAIVEGEEPIIDSDIAARLRALRATVGRAVERHAELVSRSQALGQKIAALELQYPDSIVFCGC